MNNITLIAAIGKNNELGKNGDLIWKFKEDLDFFKSQTMGKPMVMGYNTFYSLRKGKPLPGREHIVLTSKNIDPNPQITVVRSVDELLKYIEDYKDEVMVIGGAMLYNTMLPYANKLVLSEIDAKDSEAEVYFPVFNKNEWSSKLLGKQEEKGISYKHIIYTRKKVRFD